MRFKHHQLVEIYSALKEGTWINQETKDELVEKLEQYFIAVARHNDFQIKTEESR